MSKKTSSKRTRVPARSWNDPDRKIVFHFGHLSYATTVDGALSEFDPNKATDPAYLLLALQRAGRKWLLEQIESAECQVQIENVEDFVSHFK